ncbi:MAG: ABC transporter substrate-binding protein [Kiloniellales bacterium]
MRKLRLFYGITGAVAAGLMSVSALAAENIRIGLIEPLSGPIAAVGAEALDNFTHVANQVNKRGGVLGGRKLEIIGLDNAMKAEKTTEQLKKAVDMGLSYIIQGVGSNHALNIIKFVNKHNKRNPGKEIVFLNHSAVTTAFTNELCSFWHFRFDANVDMKVAALVTQLNRDPKVKKVYLVNQNYAYGKSFQAAANRLLKERAPNVELVGDELIVPFGKVQDFTPYVAKIKAAGADTVLTGNWGPDLHRFVKSAVNSGLGATFYSIYGGLPSSISGYGDTSSKVDLKQVTETHENHAGLPGELRDYMQGYKDVYGSTWYPDRQRWLIEMLAAAIEAAGTADPIPVARKLEGMSFPGPLGDVQMRAEDHQIQMALVVSTLTSDAPKSLIYKGKNFGVGFKTDGVAERADTTLPTTCLMERPN